MDSLCVLRYAGVINMKKTILFLIVMVAVGLSTAEYEESLYVERTHKTTKKNKSLDAVREEFVRTCEACMHAVIREIRVIRSVCKKFEKASGDHCIRCMFGCRGMQLKHMHLFFSAPGDAIKQCTEVVCTHTKTQAVPLEGLALVGAIAMVQEDLLQTMSHMVELASSSLFVCAPKKELMHYCVLVNQFIKESDDFCAQALALPDKSADKSVSDNSAADGSVTD